ncbi:MAG TPA: hypothetical protein VFF28_01550 [Candidatus Nanoarchaeia archaeon]|nr:hypothetical protein [Candidatus Nanoarchaeia archaeon]
MSLKIPIAITLIVISLGAFVYFTGEREMETEGAKKEGAMEEAEKKAEKKMEGKESSTDEILSDISIKVAYTEEGTIKIFALAKNNDLADLKAYAGKSIPEKDSIVIGYSEAKLMTDENLFSKPGDPINGLSGIDTKVEGILAKTNTEIDDFYFVSATQFRSIAGDENAVLVSKEEGMNRIIYSYQGNSNVKFNLNQGDLKDYGVHEIAGVKYYPALLGSKEAKQFEKDKIKVGDFVKIMGKNAVIVGVIEETGTALDMMILFPFVIGDEQ